MTHDPGLDFLAPSHDYGLARQIHHLEMRIRTNPQSVSSQLEALFYKDFRHAMGLLRHYRELCENDQSRSFITAIMMRMHERYNAPLPPGHPRNNDAPRSQS